MLSGENRIAFCQATAFWNCEDHLNKAGALLHPENVVEASDTVNDFIMAYGFPEKFDTPVGQLLYWSKIKVEKKRVDLFVMDFGTVRGSFFDDNIV
jgi:hypothetical protein